MEAPDSKRALFFLVAVCILASFSMVAAVSTDDSFDSGDSNNVLLLNSYHENMLWVESITNGVCSVLEYPENKLYIEYMDTKFVSDQEYYNILYDLYDHKYRDIKFDIVICSDVSAFSFLCENHDSLFPKTPVVFCGLNYPASEMCKCNSENGFFGFSEELDFRGTIDLALKLHPDTKNVFVVNDRTPEGLLNRELLEALEYEYEDLNFFYSDDFTMQELLTEVSELSDESIILLMSFYQDAAGEIYFNRDVAALISQHSHVPIYSVQEFYLGEGIVGGYLTSGSELGTKAALIAKDILDGVPVSDIDMSAPLPVLMFDYNQLIKFGIDSGALPGESVVINLPNETLVIPVLFFQVASVAGAALLGGVVVLLIYSRELQKVRRDLEKSRERFLLAMDATKDGLWDWNIKKDKIYVSPSYWKMLGYDPDEFGDIAYGDWHSLQHPDDRRLFSEKMKDVLDGTKNSYNIESRLKQKLGDYKWVRRRGEVVSWEDSKPARMVVTATDASDLRDFDALKEANKKLNILSSITRHDVLNQITGINGYVDFITEDISSLPDLDDVKIYLSKVAVLVGNIQHEIEFTRDYQDLGVNSPEWQDVSVVIMRCVRSVNSNLKIENLVKGLKIFADPMLEKVFVNLIDNAVRHGGDNISWISFSTYYKDDKAFVVVQDDGCGVPEDKKEMIFKKGFGDNTGFGLYLTENILSITRITIRECGVPGEGARFEICVPVGSYSLNP